MPKRKPIVRPAPKTGSLSQPHLELLGDVTRCLERLQIAREVAAQKSAEALAAGDTVGAHLALGSPEAQMYSRGAQVFAAMAVEAMLNCYGLWHFGEDEFERYFGRMSTVEKLRELVALTRHQRLAPDAEIVRSVESLMAKRNAHVHLRAEEMMPDAQGVFRDATQRRRPRRGDAGATEAVQEAYRFFELFGEFTGGTMILNPVAPSA